MDNDDGDDDEDEIKTRSRITDLALVHWQEGDIINPQKSDCEDETFVIEQERVLALVEIKQSPSWKLIGLMIKLL